MNVDSLLKQKPSPGELEGFRMELAKLSVALATAAYGCGQKVLNTTTLEGLAAALVEIHATLQDHSKVFEALAKITHRPPRAYDG